MVSEADFLFLPSAVCLLSFSLLIEVLKTRILLQGIQWKLDCMFLKASDPTEVLSSRTAASYLWKE